MNFVVIFTVVLPTLLVGLFAYCVYLTKAVERSTDSPCPTMETKALRILIVDDSETTRRVVGTILRSRHWSICGEAEDGREAISKATDLRPDLIILDFKMPLADGLQAAQEIGRNLPTTPIVMDTLYKDKQLESVAKSAGVRRVVAKEEGVHELLGAIEAEVRECET